MNCRWCNAALEPVLSMIQPAQYTGCASCSADQVPFVRSHHNNGQVTEWFLNPDGSIFIEVSAPDGTSVRHILNDSIKFSSAQNGKRHP